MSTAQQIAEDVEQVVEEIEAGDAPARRVRRRPLALQPKPGELTWICPCEGCRDLVAMQLAKLTDEASPASAPATDDDVSDGWRALCAEDEPAPVAAPARKRGGLHFITQEEHA